MTDVAEDPPPAPQGLGASLTGGTFSLSWSPVAGAAHYEAQYLIAGSGEDWASVGTTTATVLTYSPASGPECGSTYEFRVRAYGDGEAYASVLGAESGVEPVGTEACNRDPEFGSPIYRFSIAENAATSTLVGTTSATDLDIDDEVRYAITAGNEEGGFSIGDGTGDIRVASALDHETTPSYRLTVEAGDGRGGAATTTVGVSVTDVAEDLPPAPQGLSASLADGTFLMSCFCSCKRPVYYICTDNRGRVCQDGRGGGGLTVDRGAPWAESSGDVVLRLSPGGTRSQLRNSELSPWLPTSVTTTSAPNDQFESTLVGLF